VLTFKPALENTYCKDGDGNDAYGGTRYTCEGAGVLGNFVAPKPRTCVDGLLDGNITIMASDNNKGTINFKSHPLGGNFTCEYAQDPFECMCTGLTHRIFSISKENYCLSEDGTRDNSRTTAQKCEKELEDGSYSKMGDFYVPITKSKCSDGCMISDPPNVTKDQCDELPGNYMFTESRQTAFCLKWLTSADDFPDYGSENENLFVRRPGMPITRGITLTKQRQGFSNEFKILLKPDHLNFEEWKEELELDPSKDNYDTLNTECEYARKKSPFTCLIANVDVTYENVGDLTKGAWGAGRAFDGEYPSEEGYCTGFRNNNTWVIPPATCTSSDGTVMFNETKAVWNPEDISSFRFKCEGGFTNSTYSPPEASECTNSSSKVYDHLHFLYGDLEFEMALCEDYYLSFLSRRTRSCTQAAA
jgi:hypothetical protein